MAEKFSAALEVSGLSKNYAGVRALNDVSLAIQPGEIVGLLGANGAGKTTMLDIIGGEQEADAGTVRMNGALLGGPPHRRARAGLARTFQHPKVAADLTVIENVAVGLAVTRLAGRRTLSSLLGAAIHGRANYTQPASQACATVGLEETQRYASQLSFGELRLLEVARALVQQPRVLLLDEPFPGLDDDGVANLSSAIRRAAGNGRAVILVDHNLSLVQALVDRVVLLARGTVAFRGTAAECLASPEFQYEYIGAATHG